MKYVVCFRDESFVILLHEVNDIDFANFGPKDLVGIPCYFKMNGGVPEVWPKPQTALGIVIYRLEEQPVL